MHKLSREFGKDTSYSEKENLPRKSGNYEHLYPKCVSTHIQKLNFIKDQKTQWNPHKNSEKLLHLNLINGQITETETKQRHSETNWGYESNEFKRYLQNTSL